MTCDYTFLADLLNKFLQLTPWVQVLLAIVICITIAISFYLLKEIITIIFCSIIEWKHGYQ